MTQHIIRAGGFFDPPGIKLCQALHVIYGLAHIPALVGVQHELPVPPDFFANNCAAAVIIFNIAADLDLEMRPTLRDGFTA